MKIINIFWIVLGFICLGLGIIGIIMPILPTTPFFIVTVVCFAKGSERLERWFMSSSFHKKYIQSFLRKYFRNPCNHYFQAVSSHQGKAGKNNFPVQYRNGEI